MRRADTSPPWPGADPWVSRIGKFHRESPGLGGHRGVARRQRLWIISPRLVQAPPSVPRLQRLRLRDVWILYHLEPPASATTTLPDGGSGDGANACSIGERGRAQPLDRGPTRGKGGRDGSEIWNRGSFVRGQVEPVWVFSDEYRNRPHRHSRTPRATIRSAAPRPSPCVRASGLDDGWGFTSRQGTPGRPRTPPQSSRDAMTSRTECTMCSTGWMPSTSVPRTDCLTSCPNKPRKKRNAGREHCGQPELKMARSRVSLVEGGPFMHKRLQISYQRMLPAWD